MYDSVVMIDGAFAVLCSNEKTVLIREIVKHYTQRWINEAAEKDNKEDYLKTAVSSMLKKISVDHIIVDSFEKVDVFS